MAWSAEQIDYLHTKWGSVSIPSIAKFLGRSVNAIKCKAFREGLTRFMHSGDYITLNQLMLAIRGRNISTYALTSWVKNRGLPVKTKKSISHKYKIIYLKDFWKWAEQNRTFIDFSKFEENMLGEEPAWAKEQRRLDCIRAIRFKKTPWTPADDDKLRFMLRQYKYGYTEISAALQRTEGAVKRRLSTLGIKERPLKADRDFWTDEETEELIKLVDRSYSWELIADKIGKSALACRGKHERLQNPDYMRDYRIKQRSVAI